MPGFGQSLEDCNFEGFLPGALNSKVNSPSTVTSVLCPLQLQWVPGPYNTRLQSFYLATSVSSFQSSTLSQNP